VWPPNHPPMAPGLSARGPHPKTGKMTIRNLNTPYQPVPRRGPNTPGWGTQPGDPGYGGGGGGRGFGNALGKLFLTILGVLDLTAGKAHAPIFIPPFLTNPDTPTPGAIPIGMDDPYYNWGSVPIPPGGFGNPQGQQAPTGRDARIARIANVKDAIKNRNGAQSSRANGGDDLWTDRHRGKITPDKGIYGMPTTGWWGQKQKEGRRPDLDWPFGTNNTPPNQLDPFGTGTDGWIGMDGEEHLWGEDDPPDEVDPTFVAPTLRGVHQKAR